MDAKQSKVLFQSCEDTSTGRASLESLAKSVSEAEKLWDRSPSASRPPGDSYAVYASLIMQYSAVDT